MKNIPHTNEIWTKIDSDNSTSHGIKVKIEEVKKNTILFHKLDSKGEPEGSPQWTKIEIFRKNYIKL